MTRVAACDFGWCLVCALRCSDLTCVVVSLALPCVLTGPSLPLPLLTRLEHNTAQHKTLLQCARTTHTIARGLPPLVAQRWRPGVLADLLRRVLVKLREQVRQLAAGTQHTGIAQTVRQQLSDYPVVVCGREDVP